MAHCLRTADQVFISKTQPTTLLKLNSNYCKLLALAAGVSLAVPASAPAAIVLTLQEVGTDVVLSTPGGSINQSLLVTPGTGYSRAISGLLASLPSAPAAFLVVGSVPAATSPALSYTKYNFITAISGPTSIGTRDVILDPATSSNGALFGFILDPGSASELYLPDGANLGALGQGDSTFANTNLATLGITAGTYVWTIGTNPTTDTITLNVIGGASVPESASLLVPAMAISALGLVQLRRRSRQA